MARSPDPHEDTRITAQEILTRALGGEVRLGKGKELENRGYVLRFRVLDGPAGSPKTVISKAAPVRTGKNAYDPDVLNGHTRRFFRDWSGSEFLSQLSSRLPVPRFYGGDRREGFILLEDIGQGSRRTDHLLMGKDHAAAENALIRTWQVIGRMHAATIGKKHLYDRVRNALGPVDPAPTISGTHRELVKSWADICTLIGVAPCRGYKTDLKAVARFIAAPGRFGAFTHGDACPGNDLFVGGRWRWLDYGESGFTHALQDGVYPRIQFPTCWCVRVLPERILLKVEAAYRAELAKGCPEAGDDALFYQGMTEACAYWSRTTFYMMTTPAELLRGGRSVWQERLDVAADSPWWGPDALRCRVLTRLDAFARAAETYNHIEALGATAAAITRELRTRWPEDVHEMATYPAFD